MADNKNDETETPPLPRQMKIIIYTAITAMAVVLLIYFYNFNDGVGQQETFGQFGDFVGGVLNPFLTFLTIFLLVWSINIQMRELKLTRQELEFTRDELKQSTEALDSAQKAHHKSYELQLNQSRRKELQDAFEYLFAQCDSLFSLKLEYPELIGGSKSLYEISDIILNTKIFGLDSEEKNGSLELVRIISKLVQDEEYNPGPNRSFYITCQQSVVELCTLLEEFHKYIETQVVSESYSRRASKLLAVACHTSLIKEDYNSLEKMIRS